MPQRRRWFDEYELSANSQTRRVNTRTFQSGFAGHTAFVRSWRHDRVVFVRIGRGNARTCSSRHCAICGIDDQFATGGLRAGDDPQCRVIAGRQV